MNAKSTTDLLRELAGRNCQCGRIKKARQTFCQRCYFRLPPAMRHALYDRIGEGYEAAYQRAVDYLASKGATDEHG